MDPTDEPRQPRARCGLGFSCALMMMQPGLEPHNCENYRTCGAAVAFPPVAEFVLLRRMEPLSNVGDLHTIRARELVEWHTNRTQAAVAMLRQRGAPQTLADFGLPALLDELDRATGKLRSALQRVRGYVAPVGAVIGAEWRGGKRRLRLVTAGRLFSGARGGGRVRAIHLGGEHDERTQEAREGIVRRNRLHTAHKLVDEACKRMQEAQALIDALVEVGGEQDEGRRGERGDTRLDAEHTGDREGDDGQRGSGGQQRGDEDPEQQRGHMRLDAEHTGDREGEGNGTCRGDGMLVDDVHNGEGGDGDRGESVLLRRGAHQRPEGSNLDRRLTQVEALATTLRTDLEQFAPAGTYIAPPDCETHRYNVKRPGRDRRTGEIVVRVYQYNKLTSTRAIFEPAQEPQAVKVVHLSHDDDPRNREARAGIVRRNRLKRVSGRLRAALENLEQAADNLGDQGVDVREVTS